MSNPPLYIGIDLGTGGVRALAITATGKVIASTSQTLQKSDSNFSNAATANGDAQNCHEQQPEAWWRLTADALTELTATITASGANIDSIQALAVDGTSGTVLGVDDQFNATTPGIMYNDQRATAEADLANKVAADAGAILPTTISASFGIAKLVWLSQHRNSMLTKTKWFGHQSDFINWRLLKQGGATDYSNALKTGCDLINEAWPKWLDAFEDVRKRLPQLVAPGKVIGQIHDKTARQLGLPAHTKIVAGCTDGTAGFLASGARNPGDDNTTLGTTLVFKRLSSKQAIDPAGLVYSHKLPGDRWLPGAASNVGGEWIRQHYAHDDLFTLDHTAHALLPIDALAYPLSRQGERFPFKESNVEAFTIFEQDKMESQCDQKTQRYAANLQGTAFVERLCYESLDKLTADRRLSSGDVFATGGGAASDIWIQLRSDINGRTYHRPACPESAIGAAVLAITGATGLDVFDVIQDAVQIEKTFTPHDKHKAKYEELYEAFKVALVERGYIE